MLLQKDQLTAEYKDIRQRWQDACEDGDNGPRLHIFCGADVDALCSLKILLAILHADRVKVDVEPVRSARVLVDRLGALPPDEPHIAILLNVGGEIPLADSGGGLKDNVDVHVIDSRRPLHLANVRPRDDGAAEQVKVWHSGDVARHFKKCFGKKGRPSSPMRKRRRRDSSETSSDGSYEPTDSDEEVDDVDEQARMEKMWYRGTWHGTPSTCILDAVAQEVMVDAPDDNIWFAAVAASAALLDRRLPQDSRTGASYNSTMRNLLDRVAERNLRKPRKDKPGLKKEKDDDEETRMEYRAYHDCRLEESQEYRLFLLRHSSLWDALYHSSYVASRLRLYSSSHHRDRLRNILRGRLGLADERTKGAWVTGVGENEWTDESQAATLSELCKLLKEKPYWMNDFQFRSMVRQHGYQGTQSAPDVARIAAAVLAQPMAPPEPGKASQRDWTDAFWLASETLEGRHVAEGVRVAKALQAAVVRQCSFLLHKEQVRNLGPFRFAYVNEASTDLVYFTSPLSLAHLARTLRECLQQQAEQARAANKPLFVIALDEARGTYLVANAAGREAPTSEAPCTFAHDISKAELTVKGGERECDADAAAAGCLHLGKSEVQPFLDQLAFDHYAKGGLAVMP